MFTARIRSTTKVMILLCVSVHRGPPGQGLGGGGLQVKVWGAPSGHGLGGPPGQGPEGAPSVQGLSGGGPHQVKVCPPPGQGWTKFWTKKMGQNFGQQNGTKFWRRGRGWYVSCGDAGGLSFFVNRIPAPNLGGSQCGDIYQIYCVRINRLDSN